MKIKTRRTANRAEAYRRYTQKVDAGYQNPLDPAGSRHSVHATHIDRFGLRYDLSPIKRIQDSLDLRKSGRTAPPVSAPFYRPSRRQGLIGCDACGVAHVHTNIYCVANPHCVRADSRLDPGSRFNFPCANSGQTEILYSLIPGRYPTYKARIIELNIIGKCVWVFRQLLCSFYIYLVLSQGKRKSGKAVLEFLTRSIKTPEE